VTELDSVVIGGGQGGLSASYHLKRRGLAHVLLDANDRPGGAWQHRWDSLTMSDVHGVAALPDSEPPVASEDRAKHAVARYFADYEREHDLPVLRPVRVDRVTSVGDLLEVTAGDRSWQAPTIVNATGTWDRPFVPHYPGIETFSGEQLHTVDYPGAAHFAGRRVLVVGGGASAVQFLGELAPVTETL
jgi:cation diffusion facilitator CzcD-associated flavoprotein CzcO